MILQPALCELLAEPRPSFALEQNKTPRLQLAVIGNSNRYFQYLVELLGRRPGLAERLQRRRASGGKQAEAALRIVQGHGREDPLLGAETAEAGMAESQDGSIGRPHEFVIRGLDPRISRRESARRPDQVRP